MEGWPEGKGQCRIFTHNIHTYHLPVLETESNLLQFSCIFCNGSTSASTIKHTTTCPSSTCQWILGLLVRFLFFLCFLLVCRKIGEAKIPFFLIILGFYSAVYGFFVAVAYLEAASLHCLSLGLRLPYNELLLYLTIYELFVYAKENRKQCKS